MGWTKLDDGFFTHPKIVDLSKDAKLVYLCALTYASKHLTNGFLSHGAVRVVMSMVDVAQRNCNRIAAELQRVGAWVCQENGFLIHDYLDYNPSSEQVRQERERTAARVAEWRKRNGLSNTVTNAVTSGVSNGVRTPAPVPVPVPIGEYPDQTVVTKGESIPSRHRSAAAAAADKPSLEMQQMIAEVAAAAELITFNPKHLDTLITRFAAKERAWLLDEASAAAEWIHSPKNKRKQAMSVAFLRNWYERADKGFGAPSHEGQHDHQQRHNSSRQPQPQRHPQSTRQYPKLERLTEADAARFNSRHEPGWQPPPPPFKFVRYNDDPDLDAVAIPTTKPDPGSQAG